MRLLIVALECAMSIDNLSSPTINFDKPDDPEDAMDSIFTIDDNFDPTRACNKLIQRENECEKYIMGDKLAQGGMGAIYRVYDRDFKRGNVLKVILPKIMASRQMFLSFIEEARITGQLEHPNIIPVHDLGVMDNEMLYFSMKEIQGESLDKILKRIRADEADIVEKYSIYNLLVLFRKVCDALAYAHSREIIHRDLKPENIMVGNYGEVLVVDWGLARRMSEQDVTMNSPEEDVDPLSESIGDLTRTRYGMIKGTPAFMPPEQAKGQVEEIDKRTDIFLLGSTLYAIATLSAPFLGEDVYEILENAENSIFEHPKERAPKRDLPPELCRIILKAMEPEPGDRYQHVEDIIEDIDDLLEGRTSSEQLSFKPGEFIMKEGDSGIEAYVILTGNVEVLKLVDGNYVKLVELGEGASVGEMAMISNDPRSASVRALTNTQVVVITEDLIQRGLDKLPPWMGNVVQALVQRLRATNAIVHPLFYSNCSYHVLHQLWLIYLSYGKPQTGGFRGMTSITLNVDKAIKEISLILSINEDRVTHIVSSIIESGLVEGFDEDNLCIPNIDLFNQFLAYLRDSLGITNQFDEIPDVTLFSNNSEFVVSHSLTDEDVEESPLEQTEVINRDEFLGFKKAEDLLAKFDEIIHLLHEQPKPTFKEEDEV